MQNEDFLSGDDYDDDDDDDDDEDEDVPKPLHSKTVWNGDFWLKIANLEDSILFCAISWILIGAE